MDEVKSAYKKLALLHHPDKVKQEDADAATERFKEIGGAYQRILNHFERPKAGPGGFRAHHPHHHHGHYHGGDMDYDDDDDDDEYEMYDSDEDGFYFDDDEGPYYYRRAYDMEFL